MAIWCVCYDLLAEPFPESPGIRGMMSAALPAIPEALAALGPSVPVSPSACLVACDLSVEQIMERLWPHVLNPRERVIVLPVAAGAPWGTHTGEADDPVVAWLAKHSAQ